SPAISVTAQGREPQPSRRRSTTAIVPITVTRAMTWTVSTIGKVHSEEATKSPTGVASRARPMPCRSMVCSSGRREGDEASGDHDRAPQQGGDHRRGAGDGPPGAGAFPEGGVAEHRRLEAEAEQGCQGDQDHLPPEDRAG